MKKLKKLIKELDEIQRKIEDINAEFDFITCLGKRFRIVNIDTKNHLVGEIVTEMEKKRKLKEEIKNLLDKI